MAQDIYSRMLNPQNFKNSYDEDKDINSCFVREAITTKVNISNNIFLLNS